MRKKLKNIVLIVATVLILSACGNDNSKVNQVIQEQIANTSEEDTISEEVIVADDNSVDNSFNSINVEEGIEKTVDVNEPAGDLDVDLTTLSSTMVYSEVYNMMYYPDNYLEKLVRMKGAFSYFQDEETGQQYFACIISDATACCAQGIEFVLEGDFVYPDDYPNVGDEITVTGIFETYDEDGYMYCRLREANLE